MFNIGDKVQLQLPLRALERYKHLEVTVGVVTRYGPYNTVWVKWNERESPMLMRVDEIIIKGEN